MNQQVVETDIAVVGAGGCGLTASLVAAGLGKRVLLLERADEVGGSTAMSAGIFVAAGSQLQLANGESGTAEELAADILRLNDGQSDAGVTMALCRASGPLMDWLVAKGVPLEHMPVYRYPGMSRAWMLSPPQRHGLVITDVLLRKVREQPNIDLRLRTRVTGLTTAG
ncbi:MAG TPA: FAD-dependent oxidoreductase, partial [Anaerolineae bacterium]|nr:FAD-dependent oxidoreductase [Anaerolineae bacterium]